MNCKIKKMITICLLLVITASVIPVQATQVYKGNGTPGGLVPDFTQQSIANNSGICAGAAFANSLWYFDQHNYSNLVSQTDESKPNDNWVNDSKKLTLELAYLIYGKEYVDKKSNKINKTPISELMKGYLKIKSPSNFTVKYFNGSNASYAKWESELNRSEDVIAVVSWWYANDTKVFNGTHAITGVGYDTDGGKLKVSNGWGNNHWNESKPYNESFFNEYNITNTSSNQMKIPKSNNTGADVFEGANFSKADHLLVDGFWAISPRDNKTSRVVDKRIRTEDPKIDEYQYTVFNHGDEAMYQFVLEIPVSFYNVQAPSGWSWKPWDPTLTPDITPRPPVLQPPGEEPMEVLWEPDMKGVIWYTETNPIMPGKSELNGFDGFSYQVDSHWDHSETDSFSGLSNGLSEYLGDNPGGLTTEFDLVSGPVAAEDIKCCWAKPCGTPVEQCDQETTFVLYESNATIVKTIHGYVYVDMETDVNGASQDIITAGDIRLSNWHTNYDPNTKVMPEDMDNLDVIESEYAAPITYVDVNDNGMYDLYDGVVYDLDNDSVVSDGDILQTDIPAVDVYSLEEFNAGEFVQAQGEDGQAWDRVNNSHPAKGMVLASIDTGVAEDLMKWVDADDSNDWSCEDKLYLIQPHECEAMYFDYAVTVGDTRVYIPEGDECIPDGGTKVVQGDHDATYMLMTNLDDARLAHFTYDDEEVYVDIDNDGKVSFGDIRLTNVSNHYGPNTKVKICDEFDLGHNLTQLNQTSVRYVETDDLIGYTLGDAVYVDVDDSHVVSEGDIRLVEVEAYMPGNPVPFVYPAWSVVDSNDVDVGDVLLGLLDRDGVVDGADYPDLNEVLGYIDTDCTGTWTCPDKLYIQQIIPECENFQLNLGVTVGDLRLYVPVNDPNSPFFGMEEWPDCGTKVTLCNIDVEYGVTEVFEDYELIKFVDRNNDGIFTEGVDHVYVDMDDTDDVTVGDVRLTDVNIKYDTYVNNTKVDDHDLDRAGTMMDADLYVTVSDEDLLAVVPYVAGYLPEDPTVELPTESFNFTVSMFDNDCSGDWTCVDALYLSIDDQFWVDDFAVTHKDIRLYIPPNMICDEEPDCDYHAYDANQDGIISIGEVNTAIDDYRTQGPTSIADVSELIDMYRTGEPYC